MMVLLRVHRVRSNQPASHRMGAFTVSSSWADRCQRRTGHRQTASALLRLEGPQELHLPSSAGVSSGFFYLEVAADDVAQIQIYPQQPSSCALARLQLVGCQVSGSLLFILANSIQSLRELGLAGCGGISLDETIEILEVIGPRLSTLTLRGNRFIAAFTERSFDAALAGCQELQELRLDLALPISCVPPFLPKLRLSEE